MTVETAPALWLFELRILAARTRRPGSVREAADLGADRDDQKPATGIGEVFRVIAEQV
jgi:hypothetical protein